MSIITLTTDYGLKDHFVGALKGKILSDYSEAQIIDISHDIDPFNTLEASYIISAAYKSFPDGSVHIIGVDIEMNKENQHLAIQWDNHYFICADNGILSMLMQRKIPQKIVSINIHDRFSVEATDLDIFIKVACHLAKGGLLNVIGKEATAIKQVSELTPMIANDKNSIKGYVIYIDHFGNVVTNITKQLFLELAKGRSYEIVVNEKIKQNQKKNIRNIWAKYSDIATENKYPIKNYEGAKLAIFNEAGFLEIAVFRSNPATVGSANSLLGLNYRDVVSIVFSD
ncbi:MAG: SAM-dependent chlorinase/fluorinase [Bacteroidota bacterium]